MKLGIYLQGCLEPGCPLGMQTFLYLQQTNEPTGDGRR